VSAQAGGNGQMTRLRVSQLSRQVFSFDLGRISTLAQADVQIDIGGVAGSGRRNPLYTSGTLPFSFRFLGLSPQPACYPAPMLSMPRWLAWAGLMHFDDDMLHGLGWGGSLVGSGGHDSLYLSLDEGYQKE
jgi:hypothetical protein